MHMRRVLLVLLLGIPACHAMEDERILVMDIDNGEPVADVKVYKKPERLLSLNPFRAPLPRAAEGRTEKDGTVTLRIPRDHRMFLIYVGSDDYEMTHSTDGAQRVQDEVDAVYYVRRRDSN